MPGLTLVYDLVSPIADTLDRVAVTREKDRPNPEALSILLREPHLALLSSGYSEYPITVVETADHVIYLEGRVYQAAEFPWYRSLPAIVRDMHFGDHRAPERASRWIEGLDGDFVVVVRDRRSSGVLILNDFLGRLPLYLHRTDEFLIVSRDLSVITRALGGVSFNRLAMAEHLLYGYPLGERTLFAGIERVPPFAVIQIQQPAKRIVLSTLKVHSVAPDLDIKAQDLEELATDLTEKFKRSCAARAHACRVVLSLSGGLNSRSVAVALQTGGVRFAAVTRGTRPKEPDVRLAAKVASVLQSNWRAVGFPRPSGSDVFRLLRLKSGMNYLGMAFILPFFDLLQAEYGRGITFLTGDGGDKVLPDLRPQSKIVDLKALTDYVLAKHQVFQLSTAARLTGVAVSDIVAALEQRLRSYSEENLEEKHIHFVLFERGFKWLFEGEDRNRQFFWSAAPFYGIDFFRLAMKCPPQFKANYSLYRRFMESLGPNLVDVESTTCGPSLRAELHPVYWLGRAVRKRSPRFLKRRLRRYTSPSVGDSVLVCIREQAVPSSTVTSYLSQSYMKSILGQLDRTQAYMLLTLTSTIEYFTTGQSTLDRRGDSYFT